MKPETQRKTTSRTKTTVAKGTRTPQVEVLPAVETPNIEPATPEVEAPAAKKLPTRDDIARRAYEIYVARGKSHGCDLEDWAQAERELLGACHRNN